jgi:UDPglucose 6-dehydrogenase
MKSKIGIIGLGKLGFPLAVLLNDSGLEVHVNDADLQVLKKIESEISPIDEPEIEKYFPSKNKMRVHESVLELSLSVDVIFIIVPTPSLKSNEFSNEILIEVLKEIGSAVKIAQQKIIINIVSTVMPGSCDNVFTPLIENISGKKSGTGFELCYNPEFIAIGSVIKDMQYPDIHLIGCSSKNAGELTSDILKRIIKRKVNVKILKNLEAELVKIAINNFITMKITFANMITSISHNLGIESPKDILESVGSDSRIGLKYLQPGTSYGGPCFPRDTLAFASLLKSLNLNDGLPVITNSINDEFNYFIVELIKAKVEKNSTIGIIGLTYKPYTTLTDESSALKISEILSSQGYKILQWDPQLSKDDESIKSIVNSCDFIYFGRPVPDIAKHILAQIIETKDFFDPWYKVQI